MIVVIHPALPNPDISVLDGIPIMQRIGNAFALSGARSTLGD